MPRKEKLERSWKQKVKDVLDPRKPFVYYNMPVPSGFGKSMLDFVGCYYGFFFMVETKRENKDLTGVQEVCRDEVLEAGGVAFRVSSDAELAVFTEWLDHILLRHMREKPCT